MKAIRVYVLKYKQKPHLMLRMVDAKGKVIRSETSGTANRREAERIAAQIETRENEACERVTWKEFRNRYISEHASGLARATEKKIRAAFHHVETHLAPVSPQELTASALSTLQQRIRASVGSESTVKGNLSHLRAALIWGHSVGLLERVPVFPKTPRASKSKGHMKGRPLTEAELAKMLDATGDIVGVQNAPGWRRFLQGMWLSGLRLAEGMALSWSDTAPLRVTLVGNHFMLAISDASEKGHTGRLLPITPDFEQFLRDTPENTGLVFPLPRQRKRKGKSSVLLTEWRVSRIVTAIGLQAGVFVTAKKPASLHDFRRSFAERWSWHVQPQVLMHLMRHEDIKTTLRYYVGKDASKTADHLKAVCNGFCNGQAVERWPTGQPAVSDGTVNPLVLGSSPSRGALS